MPTEKQIQEILDNAIATGSGEITREEAIKRWKTLNPGWEKSGEGSEFVDGIVTKNTTPWELGAAGKAGVGAQGTSVISDIMSLATAGSRQKETVKAYEDLANLTGEATEVDPSARNQAILNTRGDSEDRVSTLATLLDQGVDPASAAKIIEKQKRADATQLTSVLDSYGKQKQTAEEAAKNRRLKIDAMATQEGLPIDYWGEASNILSGAAMDSIGLESILNPLPTDSARSGKTLKYEDGGDLQMTQGASDHSENPMVITNKDGSPAVDKNGNQIEVTGKETIVPDWLFDQLIEAYNKGPKELKKVFKDEIVDEERFNQA
jgi:hypothetical protein